MPRPLEIRPEPSDQESAVIAEALSMRGADQASGERRSAWWRTGVHENAAAESDADDAARL